MLSTLTPVWQEELVPIDCYVGGLVLTRAQGPMLRAVGAPGFIVDEISNIALPLHIP